MTICFANTQREGRGFGLRKDDTLSISQIIDQTEQKTQLADMGTTASPDGIEPLLEISMRPACSGCVA